MEEQIPLFPSGPLQELSSLLLGEVANELFFEIRLVAQPPGLLGDGRLPLQELQIHRRARALAPAGAAPPRAAQLARNRLTGIEPGPRGKPMRGEIVVLTPDNQENGDRFTEGSPQGEQQGRAEAAPGLRQRDSHHRFRTR